MNKRICLIYILVSLVTLVVMAVGGQFVAAAATPTPTPSPTLMVTPTETSVRLRDDTLLHDNSLLTTDSNCSPPCWHGITPGQTKWDDALTILKADPGLANVTIQKYENSLAISVDFQQRGGSPCCQLFSRDGQTVNLIFLSLAPTITLGQLIAAQGKPKYVFDSPYIPDQIVMELIYPDKSLTVYAFIGGTGGTLSADSLIVGSFYDSSTDTDLMLKTSSLHAWEGYQSYQAYDSSIYVVTPSITSSAP